METEFVHYSPIGSRVAKSKTVEWNMRRRAWVVNHCISLIASYAEERNKNKKEKRRKEKGNDLCRLEWKMDIVDGN